MLQARLGHDEKRALFFQIGIREAVLPQKFCSRHLEVNQINRVMQIAHRVCLGISHPHGKTNDIQRFLLPFLHLSLLTF